MFSSLHGNGRGNQWLALRAPGWRIVGDGHSV